MRGYSQSTARNWHHAVPRGTLTRGILFLILISTAIYVAIAGTTNYLWVFAGLLTGFIAIALIAAIWYGFSEANRFQKNYGRWGVAPTVEEIQARVRDRAGFVGLFIGLIITTALIMTAFWLYASRGCIGHNCTEIWQTESLRQIEAVLLSIIPFTIPMTLTVFDLHKNLK